MEDNAFAIFRNEVIASLNEHDVAYKLVGGSVVQLIDNTRETADLDMLIKNSTANIDRLILALADCKFATAEELQSHIYGDEQEPIGSYDAYQLAPSNPRWEGFYIDMCLQLSGQFTYENTPSEEHTTSAGLTIYGVPYSFVAHMKRKVYPQMRPQDIEDIITISEHLGLDPVTGLPIEQKPVKKRKRRKKGQEL